MQHIVTLTNVKLAKREWDVCDIREMCHSLVSFFLLHSFGSLTIAIFGQMSPFPSALYHQPLGASALCAICLTNCGNVLAAATSLLLIQLRCPMKNMIGNWWTTLQTYSTATASRASPQEQRFVSISPWSVGMEVEVIG